MNRHVLRTLSVAVSLALSLSAAGAPASGVDTAGIDRTVRPQDDFYAYVNGNWLKAVEIPPNRTSWNTFAQLAQDAQTQLRDVIEAARADPSAKPGSDLRKIGDLYASVMDVERRESLGYKPLAGELQRIRTLKDKRGIPALVAHLDRIGVDMPYMVSVDQDPQAPTRYAVTLTQDGLGLPDRDFYLNTDDAKLAAARNAYQRHVAQILALAGDADAGDRAAAVVAFETELARAQWSRAALLDPVRNYNKFTPAALAALAPGYDWKAALAEAGVGNRIDDVIVGQPGYLAAFDRILADTDLATLKAYFEWHLLHTYAPRLSQAFVDANFDFYGRALVGRKQNGPTWMLGMAVVEKAMGEALGRAYVVKRFPAEHKRRIDAIVANLLAAWRDAIARADWLEPATRQAAQAKLAALTLKIGYPDKWRDYTRLAIKPDDLVGNTMRAAAFEYQRCLDRLGKPVDRGEWGMTPQTVNAYYNPQLNEAVFPASLLQPPFFDAAADDAANYGAIGAVIAHEIAQAIDEQGGQWDGEGRLRPWWTAADRARYQGRIADLVRQYDGFVPLPGYHVDGRLTLAENAADNASLQIAYQAWRLSLQGEKSPVIDGFTGEQRFFMGYARVWRTKTRDAQQIAQLKSDPHAPPRFRVDGPLRNLPAFHDAFGVRQGDPMYLPPDRRVSVW